MKHFYPTIITAAALSTAASAQNHDHSHARPDGHAPISIMGDHVHAAGQWMISYRYMFMDMDGMYDGSDTISSAGVFAQNYAITPERMTMQMQMLGLMYAPSDTVTLMAMLPYTDLEMDHRIGLPPLVGFNGGSDTFTTRSNGIGDLTLSAMIKLLADGPHHLHATVGFSAPTGSIGQSDTIPVPGVGRASRLLPAAMQLGTGTVDFLPSITYTYRAEQWSAGAQARGVVHIDENSHGYSFGDSFSLDSWVSWQALPCLSLSTGLSYMWQDELSGTQSDIATVSPVGGLTVPTAYSENYGGQRIEAIAGVNYVIPSGFFENHRLAFDARLPLWQDRNGLSLGTDYTLTAGWQYAF